MKKRSFDSPIGPITLYEEEGNITLLTFEKEQKKDISLVLVEAQKQIIEYLSGERKYFTIPLQPKGTIFQKKVWDVVMKIPYGEMWSYEEVSITLGNKHLSRAVGGANHKNPLPIFIPCHRVIGKDGKIKGYRYGVDKKIQLLNIEGVKNGI